MSSWSIIKGLKFRQVAVLTGLFFRHPLFMFSTTRATFLAMKIAQKEYPGIHGRHNKANAFRHALWNILIAVKCHNFSNDLDLILSWTKRITDWHEEFSPNEELAKEMDLHNNRIGREMYTEVFQKDMNKIVKLMKEKLLEAIQVGAFQDFEKHQNQLVYLED
tara:strand:- start:48280 stop:48768 length:489 start_codon:yes stop_codon:yes gene_type:complete